MYMRKVRFDISCVFVRLYVRVREKCCFSIKFNAVLVGKFRKFCHVFNDSETVHSKIWKLCLLAVLWAIIKRRRKKNQMRKRLSHLLWSIAKLIKDGAFLRVIFEYPQLSPPFVLAPYPVDDKIKVRIFPVMFPQKSDLFLLPFAIHETYPVLADLELFRDDFFEKVHRDICAMHTYREISTRKEFKI